eukprot:6366799-Prymnesium_polylepis.1
MAMASEGSRIAVASSNVCSFPMRGGCSRITWPSARPTSNRGSAPLKVGCHQVRQIGSPGRLATGRRWIEVSSSRQKRLPSAHAAAQYLPDSSKRTWEMASFERRCLQTSCSPSCQKERERGSG